MSSRDEAIKAILDLQQNAEALVRDQKKIIEVQKEKIYYLSESLKMTVGIIRHFNDDPRIAEQLDKLEKLLETIDQEVQ